MRSPTSPQSFSTNATASDASSNRTPHVTCAPTDFRGGRASHARVSTPFAASLSCAPALGPSARCSTESGAVATSAHEGSIESTPPPTPSLRSFSSVPLPTPGSSAIGRDARNDAALVAGTWYDPSGLAFFVASRAMSRLGPTPTEAAHPVFVTILSRMSSAICTGSPSSPVTST